ncbi:MAG TPA: hypothetical protein VJ180_08100 [Pyrinomonadaceae bacterium]|nr:hypothetical protein [Pyrinomonadaceae bacterium]
MKTKANSSKAGTIGMQFVNQNVLLPQRMFVDLYKIGSLRVVVRRRPVCKGESAGGSLTIPTVVAPVITEASDQTEKPPLIRDGGSSPFLNRQDARNGKTQTQKRLEL